MASNGDKVTSTIENAGGLSTGENPKKIVDLNTTEPEPDLADDDILDGEDKGLSGSGEKKESITIGTTAGPESPVDNIQKKIRRAERFGVSVKLTEEEKRNSRAERFGTVAATGNDTEGTKKSEELKRKSRADRFGVPAATPTADKTEEDAKKKARLARFGEDTKVVSAANKTEEDAKKKARLARFGETTKVDSAEEDKRKARGLRFSKETSDTSSDLPGKQSINKEAAVSGNAA